MAPQVVLHKVAALRAVSFRISSTPTAQLPHAVACIAQSLNTAKDILSEPESPSLKDTDASVVVHRFITQVTTLLQDRTVEGRWAGIVLVKAAIEAGGWATLSKSLPWVRGLLGILKKPEPSTTKCLAIIALTRIFMLTWDYQTLIREITTPSLSAFVPSCLEIVESSSGTHSELAIVLESFVTLLPRHPTIFRNHQDKLKKLLLQAGAEHSPENIKSLAYRLSVLLPQCEPKNGASDKWQQALSANIRVCHELVDRVLIEVEEDWQSVAGMEANKHGLRHTYEQAQERTQASERPAFSFIYPGAQAVQDQLLQLSQYFTSATSAPVTVQLGTVFDLLSRLFATTTSVNTSKSSLAFVQGVAREEREAVQEVLPGIHVAAMGLLCAVLDLYGLSIASVAQTSLDQVNWLFSAESSRVEVRTAVYGVLQRIIELTGPSMTKEQVSSFSHIVKACCNDLLATTPRIPQQITNGTKPGSAKPVQAVMNADSFLQKATNSPTATATLPGLTKAASSLLAVLLSVVPAKHYATANRTLMDRTALLTRHKTALIAGVLNPTPKLVSSSKASSLLPLLAQEFSSEPAVEALLRPRMPVIVTGRRQNGSRSSSPEADEESEEEEDDQADDTQMDDVSGADSSTGQLASESISNIEQDVVDAALTKYLSENPSASRENLPAGVLRGLKAKEAADPRRAKATHPVMEPTHSVSQKRQLESPEKEPVKRQRSSPVAQSLMSSGAADLPGQVQTSALPRSVELPPTEQGPQRIATLPSNLTSGPSEPALAVAKETAVNEGNVSEDDDDDFVIPTLVMGDDSDEDDEE